MNMSRCTSANVNTKAWWSELLVRDHLVLGHGGLEPPGGTRRSRGTSPPGVLSERPPKTGGLGPPDPEAPGPGP
ncbi:hypothetical protein NHX12_031217 [Muraenolepis orangiensis]|uniref:Uncharacterized protein n=1 Tax=Muraenolepis orangiensis TaxID=630683 RepID=A0A9Q0E4V0_9TELE|nr:hypothetical protein NHX12_031217 [Muraenolepis orangiensis]